jgi:hypothetical protein
MQLGRLGKQHGFSQKILLSIAVDVFVQNIIVCIIVTVLILLSSQADRSSWV